MKMVERARGSLRVAGLFAGVGGIELGLERAGHETRLLCEVDPGARAVLGERFPQARLVGDVRELQGLPRGIDLLTAGFPCQDVSPVGPTLGLGGTKSSLVGEVFRLIRKSRPDWVLLENVPFMLRLHSGAVIARVVEGLEEAGYRWAYRTIDTRAFGLPQRRLRVFILASRVAKPGGVLFRGDHSIREIPADRATGFGFYWTEGNRGLGWGVDCVPTLKGGSAFGMVSAPAVWMKTGEILVPSITAGERLQGLPAGWSEPAERVVRPGRRWTFVGNAVSVPVARWIGEGLARSEEPVDLTGLVGEFPSRWPAAAFGDRRGRYSVTLGTWPVKRSWRPIAGFLEGAAEPLSPRAAAGFHSRLTRSSLRYDPEFAAAVGQRGALHRPKAA